VDTPAVGRVILMSIRPRFADAILRGEKRVEFRRKPIPADVTHVVVYATRPVGTVVGAFAVGRLDCASPDDLWTKFQDVAGIGSDEFARYFGEAEMGYALQIDEVFPAEGDWDLLADFGVSRPPQSFQYVAAERVCQKFGWAAPVPEPTQLTFA
jgi:predicted transcriptional regulator